MMEFTFYKYQGTGNDFVMIDNRNNHFPIEDKALVAKLCDRRFGIGADGLILLENTDEADFKMVYFNADGAQSSMCGNGGRCTVAFAKQLGVLDSNETSFIAIDGLHKAYFNVDGTVSLGMIDVDDINKEKGYTFLDTGSPHHVIITDYVKDIDVQTEGSKIRYSGLYGDAGANINFVEVKEGNKLFARTYERGVEAETLSCGTGVTAVALASAEQGFVNGNETIIETLGGELKVRFEEKDGAYTNIYLTGPATFVFEGQIEA